MPASTYRHSNKHQTLPTSQCEGSVLTGGEVGPFTSGPSTQAYDTLLQQNPAFHSLTPHRRGQLQLVYIVPVMAALLASLYDRLLS